jgi:hypothetical protein
MPTEATGEEQTLEHTHTHTHTYTYTYKIDTQMPAEANGEAQTLELDAEESAKSTMSVHPVYLLY